MTDARGNATGWGYDPVGRLETMTDALSGTVAFGYDLAGQRTSLTDARGEVRVLMFTDAGQVATATDPLGRVTVFDYDAVGRQLLADDAKPDPGVAMVWDDAGQLLTETSDSGVHSFAYDLAGRRTTITDPTGVTGWSYDDASRVIEVAAPAGTVGYSYTAAGERATMSQPEGTVSYGYDSIGLLNQVTDWNGAATSFVMDPDGRMLTVGRANGVDTAYGYDSAGRTTSVTHTGAGGLIDSFTYGLDPNGNRESVTSNAGTETYVLDELNRLTSVSYPDATTEAFTYDPAGNRLSHTTAGGTVTSSYDAAGQLTGTSDGVTYSYDPAGNLTGTSDGDVYGWDAYNRMTTATDGGVTQTYAYDADNVRVGVDSVGQVWDRAGGLPQLISNGSEAFLQPGGQYLATIGAGGTTYGLTDALGSIRAVTDNTGAVIGSSSFSVFGETRTGTVDTFGFTGEQHDPTGLLHLRARQYNPANGRMLSVDTVQPNAPGTGGYNLYAYTANNPTTWTDPSGHVTATEYAQRVGAGVGLIVGLGVGLWTCDKDGLRQAQCVGAYILGGVLFGYYGPLAGGGCIANAAVGAADGFATTLLAGQDGVWTATAIGAVAGCGLAFIFKFLASVRTVVREAVENATKPGKPKPPSTSTSQGSETLDDTVRTDLVDDPPSGPKPPGSTPQIDRSFQFPSAGRSGAGVKNFVGPKNAVVRGAGGDRIFVTNGQGQVILDITRARVKPVVPGQGFVAGTGRKSVPTKEQLEWIETLWG